MGMDELILHYNAEKMEVTISPVTSARLHNLEEVVRCKDCVYGKLDTVAYYHDIYGNENDTTLYHCLYGFGHNKGEHFCSYGERREGE